MAHPVAPENVGTRPRIRQLDKPWLARRYLCVGHGAYGYGLTPTEAYEQWEGSRRYVLFTPHRNAKRADAS